MADTVSDFRMRRILRFVIIVGALLLSAISAMLHGSGMQARLQGSGRWTGWVTLDLLLATLPVVVPVVAFVGLRISGRDRRGSVDRALVTWLSMAFASCALAVFWI